MAHSYSSLWARIVGRGAFGAAAGSASFAVVTLWSADRRAAAAEPAPRAGGGRPRRRQRVAVVGGGVCGLSVARHLAERGHRVTLYEREVIGAPSQASSINSGFLHAEPPAGTVVRRSAATGEPELHRGPEDWNFVLGRGVMDMYRELHARHDIEYRECGIVRAIMTDAELAAAAAQYPTEADVGTAAEMDVVPRLLSAARTLELEPQLTAALKGAVYWPPAVSATCHPRKATLAMAAEARRCGVDIVERAEVCDLRPGARGAAAWEVAYRRLADRLDPGGDEAEAAADTVVLAAGSWSEHLGELAGVTVPVIPVISIMWSTPPQPRSVRALLGASESRAYWDAHPTQDEGTPPCTTHKGRWHDGGRFSERLTRHLYGKQTDDGRFIFGGDRIPHPKHAPGLVHPLPRLPAGCDSIEANRAHAAEVLPLLGSLPVESTWAGINTYSKDGRPIIGRAGPESRPLFVCAGDKDGFAHGAMAGKLLAELIDTGEGHPVLRDLSPDRF